MLSQAQRLIDYDHDPAQPGRPLLMLLAGAALACVGLFLGFILAFRTWVTHEIDPGMAYWGISLLFCFYLLGVFVFSYAFELYDAGKALRLTLIVATFSVVGIIAVVSLLAVLSKLKGGAGALNIGGETADRAASFIPVIGSYLTDGDRREQDHSDALPPEGAPFIITCQSCGERFTPVPPAAVCPGCGRAALAASGPH